MAEFIVAICSYNRCQNLPALVAALRKQQASVPFEILVVDNNSTDKTQQVLAELANQKGAPLRFVRETQQGITHARNRAIEECLGNTYMAFIDDDELPQEGFIASAYNALACEDAECVGGAITIALSDKERPKWLVKELLGFLAEVDHADDAFWIVDKSTPIWTSNIAYRMEMFRGNRALRFDDRFNREGQGVGGGEDAVMFWSLLDGGKRIRYRPDMRVIHFVEAWRLKRSYFLKLHFVAGRRCGEFNTQDYPKSVFGVPLFMLLNVVRDWFRAMKLFVKGKPALRQAMNASYACGLVLGRVRSKKKVSG